MNDFQKNPDKQLNPDFDQTVKDFIPILKKRASFFSGYGAEFDELFQEGLVALYHAYSNYDESKSVLFKTYAVHCINNRMISYIRKTIKPSHENNSFISVTNEELENILSKEMSFEDDPQQIFVNNESFEKSRNQFFSVLSEYEKNIFTLYLSGYSCIAIAEKISVPYKSVDNALQRIKRKLRKIGK